MSLRASDLRPWLWPSLAGLLLFACILLFTAAEPRRGESQPRAKFRTMVELHKAEDTGYAKGYVDGYTDATDKLIKMWQEAIQQAVEDEQKAALAAEEKKQ